MAAVGLKMLSDFFNKNFARAMKFKVTAAARRFMAHNRRVFAPPRNGSKRDPVVLLELSTMELGHISYSYLANALAELHGARIEAYLPSVQAGLNAKILFWRPASRSRVFRHLSLLRHR